jgi:hypothetical protein
MINFKDERMIYLLLGFGVLFFYLTFDAGFGTLLFGMLFLDYMLYSMNKGNRIETFTKPKMSNKDMIMLLVIFLGFIGVTYAVGNYTFPQSFSTPFSVFQVFSTGLPPLATNPIMFLISQGIIIAVVETRLFFQRLPEVLTQKFNIPFRFDYKNTKMWMLFAMVSSAFVIYHLGVKLVTESDVLLITFIFAMFSLVAVFYFREGKQAQLLHIGNNVPAIITRLGMLGGGLI